MKKTIKKLATIQSLAGVLVGLFTFIFVPDYFGPFLMKSQMVAITSLVMIVLIMVMSNILSLINAKNKTKAIKYAVILLLAGLSLFGIYIQQLHQKSIYYINKTIVVGNTFSKELKAAATDIGLSDLNRISVIKVLKVIVPGSPEEVALLWPENEIRKNVIFLVVFYYLSVLLLVSSVMLSIKLTRYEM